MFIPEGARYISMLFSTPEYFFARCCMWQGSRCCCHIVAGCVLELYFHVFASVVSRLKHARISKRDKAEDRTSFIVSSSLFACFDVGLVVLLRSVASTSEEASGKTEIRSIALQSSTRAVC